MDSLVPRDEPYVLFGSGSSAAVALEALRLSQREVVSVFDNDPSKWGTTFFGLQIVPPSLTNHLVLIATESARTVAQQLESIGCRFTYIGPMFDYDTFERYFSGVPDSERNWLTNRLLDEASAETLSDLANFRGSGNPLHLRKSDFDQYLHPALPIEPGMTVVDAGAWIGDTAELFANRVGSNGRVICFEPDPSLAAAIPQRPQIEVVASALSDSPGKRPMLLSQSGSNPGLGGGRLASNPGEDFKSDKSVGEYVNCVALDDLNLEHCDVIKMDIEGSEEPALSGARRTIARHLPILLICAYHHFQDLWELPKVIERIAPYRFYLGHHTESAAETVLYGVPQFQTDLK